MSTETKTAAATHTTGRGLDDISDLLRPVLLRQTVSEPGRVPKIADRDHVTAPARLDSRSALTCLFWRVTEGVLFARSSATCSFSCAQGGPGRVLSLSDKDWLLALTDCSSSCLYNQLIDCPRPLLSSARPCLPSPALRLN